jgi:hypothetical protein
MIERHFYAVWTNHGWVNFDRSRPTERVFDEEFNYKTHLTTTLAHANLFLGNGMIRRFNLWETEPIHKLFSEK